MIGRFIYLQFLIPIADYVRTLRGDEFVLDWIAAAGTTVAFNLWLPVSRTPPAIDKLASTATTFLSILVGFSLTAVTILTTNDSANIQKIRQNITARQIDGKPISLFQLLHILFTYGLIIQIFALLVNILIAAIDTTKLSARGLSAICYVDIFLFAHIIFLHLRNITSLYCIFWRAE